MNFMALFYQRCERGYEENKAVKIVDKIASVSFGFVPDCFISEMLVWNDKYNKTRLYSQKQHCLQIFIQFCVAPLSMDSLGPQLL